MEKVFEQGIAGRKHVMKLKKKLERAAGIEPASSAWKAEVIAIIRCPL